MGDLVVLKPNAYLRPYLSQMSYQFLKNEDVCNKNLDVFSPFPLEFFINITERVHNRFGGMRDLANFCGDIRDGS